MPESSDERAVDPRHGHRLKIANKSHSFLAFRGFIGDYRLGWFIGFLAQNRIKAENFLGLILIRKRIKEAAIEEQIVLFVKLLNPE